VKGGFSMTLSVITEGEVLTVRSYKQFTGFSWANNYEVEATQDIANPATALENLALRIANLERGLHIEGITIDRVTISTYVPDSQPYNPNTLATFPLSILSNRPAVSEVLPLEMCLFVRRNTVFGRDGRLLYRGCLTENDMGASAFRPLLTSPAVTNLQGVITSWASIGLGAEFRFVMASGFPVPTSVRPVVNLQVSEKIVVKKYNNRYFRRNP
jgi:hypothetical protein